MNQPFASHVGTIEPRKNIIRLIQAFELVHSRIKEPLDLVLVGKRGWLYEETVRMFKKSIIRDKIMYLNYIEVRC